jgi:glutamate/tyrosine decarboxylase-like PLP-dependent enzyme
VLKGIEQADSITIDAHKWFATTMGCCTFLTRYAAILSLRSKSRPALCPPMFPISMRYVTTVQWSRRFLGLLLFLSLAAAGWVGYRKHVERSIELTELLKQQLFRAGMGYY